MDEAELKDRIRKLQREAMNLKLELHDLSEELPLGWEKIPDLAARTFEAHRGLAEAKKLLAG